MTTMNWVVMGAGAGAILVGFGTILVNLCLLGINLKLYTEFFKERVKVKGSRRDDGESR
jgi:hypothetical protein